MSKKVLTRIPKRRRQLGATMVEYVLLAALISMAGIVSITKVGTKVTEKFDKLDVKLAASGEVCDPLVSVCP